MSNANVPSAPIYLPSAIMVPPVLVNDHYIINSLHDSIREKSLAHQKTQIQKNQLEQNYPVKYVLCHSIIMIILSITVIVIQVLMIIEKSPNYFVGSGIWVGVFFLIAACLAMVLSKYIIHI